MKERMTLEEWKEASRLMSWREKRFLALHLGIQNADNPDGVKYSISECGRIFRVTKGRARSLIEKAKKKLQTVEIKETA